jgi:formamidopyrimidine-DNA glycosylase
VPELPDITVYVEALQSRILGRTLQSIRITHPFLLRTFEPKPASLEGRRVTGVRRLGKRIALGVEGDLWLVFHLMIAGRLHWFAPGSRVRAGALAYLSFDSGTLTLTEAGRKRRASLSTVGSSAELKRMDPGGLEVLDISVDDFARQLTAENHTLKRALTDPHSFSGIGNAYSDEILHRAKLSPVALTQKLDAPGIAALHEAVRKVLNEWTDRLRQESAGAFPEGVTAFRPQMAVHGRFGQPCPVCGTEVQRIRYADNETNYCPRCQTGGKMLADRALSRLLKKDWPRTIDEMEAL